MEDRREVSEHQPLERFRLGGAPVVITGGGGLLGIEHAAAVAEAGGLPVLWDLDADVAASRAAWITARFGVECYCQRVDVTDEESIRRATDALLTDHPRIRGLINNAANNPGTMEGGTPAALRFERMAPEIWQRDLDVGLRGAFFCSRVVGATMAERGGGVILNIASDLGVIAPDQRLYRDPLVPESEQPVKPVTYSVVKHGLIGLTRYVATYWAQQGVRCNALAPGGVYDGQSDAFVQRLTSLIPMGRMARRDEYRGAIQFLISEASSYMNGAVISLDGGRTVW